jgi:single-strand DNA-binding protein
MVNRVILIGRLGRDPEVRRLENGAVVAKFSMATDEYYKDKDGNQVQQTEWHNIICWRGLAEQVEKFLKKGSLIYVDGKLTHREYTDKDNQKRYFTEVLANAIKFLDRRDEKGGGGYFPTAADEPAGVTSARNEVPAPVMEEVGDAPSDDLPF